MRKPAEDIEPAIASTADAARHTVRAFLADPAHASLLARIETGLGLTKAAIERAYSRYALESLSSGNDIYDDAGTHVAMWIEYQTPAGLHAKRQAAVLSQLQRWRPASIADIGFGAPTRYLREHVLVSPSVRATLFDKYPAAIEVGRTILAHWSRAFADRIGFALHDMDRDAPVSGFDCCLLLDAVEHAAEPARYLAETVAGANDDALFLFHMPIGPLIASHSIAWHSALDATRWLEAAGLRVDEAELLRPNPVVDHFARGAVTLENLFVVARKR